jgi:hypothetical protein
LLFTAIEDLKLIFFQIFLGIGNKYIG